MSKQLAVSLGCGTVSWQRFGARGRVVLERQGGGVCVVARKGTRGALAAVRDGQGEGHIDKDESFLMDLLRAVEDGIMSVDDGARLVQAYVAERDQGADLSQLTLPASPFPQMVVGSGKTPQQIASEMSSLIQHQDIVIAVRIHPPTYAAIRKLLPGVEYHAGGLALKLRKAANSTSGIKSRLPGSVAIVTAGPEDSTVAEECRLVAEQMGCYCFKLANASSSNFQSILPNLTGLRSAAVVVVVSGSDGALPTVVAGLVNAPVVSVPTSSGSLAKAGGASAMVTCLTLSQPGVTVVGLDDGVAAAMFSARMLMSVSKINEMKEESSLRNEPNGAKNSHGPVSIQDAAAVNTEEMLPRNVGDLETSALHDALKVLKEASLPATSVGINGNGSGNGAGNHNGCVR